MPKKNAVLFGASGLVGENVLMRLISDDRYEKIKIFSRSKLSIKHNKISLVQTDFSNFEDIKQEIVANDLFCCLGTTRKKAGSMENFRKIDFDLVLKIAKVAKENKIANFMVISSVGANSKSRNFYLRTKGEMEEEILTLPFQKTVILRPSLLLGKRKEFRFLESVGKVIFGLLSFLFIGRMRKYKPNYASDVASVMIRLANVTTSKKIFDPCDINLFSNNQ